MNRIKVRSSTKKPKTFSRGCRQLSGHWSNPTAADADLVALDVPERARRVKTLLWQW